jgi:DNA-binding MarR family transcriptional regulator
LINNLEQGYLRRESLESDGRYKKLVLTEKTKEMQEDIVRRVFDYMHSMFVGIPEEHLKIFESVILQMAKNAEK